MSKKSIGETICFILTFPFSLLFVRLPQAIDDLIFNYRKRKFRLTRPNCLFLVNPSSGSRLGEKIMEIARTLGRSEETVISVFDEGLVEKVRRALASEPNSWHLIICGGDGSINACVQQLEKNLSHLERSRIVYAHMPLGTGNDMARSVGLGSRVKLNYVNEYFNRIDSPRSGEQLFDRWRCRVILENGSTFIDTEWMMYLAIGYDGETSFHFDLLRKKAPWIFKNRYINLICYPFVFLFFTFRDLFVRRGWSKLVGGSLRVDPGVSEFANHPGLRMSPGDTMQLDEYGSILFQNCLDYIAGKKGIWGMKNNDIGKIHLPQAVDG